MVNKKIDSFSKIIKEFDPSDKQSERYKWEIRSAWKIEQKDAIRRVRNIKVSTFNAA